MCGCGKRNNHAVASPAELVAAAQARADERRQGAEDARVADELAALRSQVHASQNASS